MKTSADQPVRPVFSPPLRPDECAGISACFIQDLAATIQSVADDGDVSGYAVYTPAGSEAALRRFLPSDPFISLKLARLVCTFLFLS